MQIAYGAIIGANAVVSHDIPAKSIAVGIPAHVVKNGIHKKKNGRKYEVIMLNVV